jgi:CheY-like chemotaxis protein
MLVADEEDILYTYKAFLDGLGYEVEAFSSPLDALQRFAIDPLGYCLMITDIRMSSINGLQLYHASRGLNPDMKIMFVSALDATQELLSVLPSVDREQVLKKSIIRRVLTDAVDRVLCSTHSADVESPLARSGN